MKAQRLLPAFFAMVLSACAPMDYSTRIDLLGESAPYVNVTGGETVRFVVGDVPIVFGRLVAPVHVQRAVMPPC